MNISVNEVSVPLVVFRWKEGGEGRRDGGGNRGVSEGGLKRGGGSGALKGATSKFRCEPECQRLEPFSSCRHSAITATSYNSTCPLTLQAGSKIILAEPGPRPRT